MLEPYHDPATEARLVAMLLGEASDYEQAELEALLAEDAGLRELYARLEEVHGLLRASESMDSTAAPGTDWKLPPERREAVLGALAAMPEGGDDGASPTPPDTTGATRRPNKLLLWWSGLGAAAVAVIAALMLRSTYSLHAGGAVAAEAAGSDSGRDRSPQQQRQTRAFTDAESGRLLYDDLADDQSVRFYGATGGGSEAPTASFSIDAGLADSEPPPPPTSPATPAATGRPIVASVQPPVEKSSELAEPESLSRSMRAKPTRPESELAAATVVTGPALEPEPAGEPAPAGAETAEAALGLIAANGRGADGQGEDRFTRWEWSFEAEGQNRAGGAMPSQVGHPAMVAMSGVFYPDAEESGASTAPRVFGGGGTVGTPKGEVATDGFSFVPPSGAQSLDFATVDPRGAMVDGKDSLEGFAYNKRPNAEFGAPASATDDPFAGGDGISVGNEMKYQFRGAHFGEKLDWGDVAQNGSAPAGGTARDFAPTDDPFGATSEPQELSFANANGAITKPRSLGVDADADGATPMLWGREQQPDAAAMQNPGDQATVISGGILLSDGYGLADKQPAAGATPGVGGSIAQNDNATRFGIDPATTADWDQGLPGDESSAFFRQATPGEPPLAETRERFRRPSIDAGGAGLGGGAAAPARGEALGKQLAQAPPAPPSDKPLTDLAKAERVGVTVDDSRSLTGIDKGWTDLNSPRSEEPLTFEVAELSDRLESLASELEPAGGGVTDRESERAGFESRSNWHEGVRLSGPHAVAGQAILTDDFASAPTAIDGDAPQQGGAIDRVAEREISRRLGRVEEAKKEVELSERLIAEGDLGQATERLRETLEEIPDQAADDDVESDRNLKVARGYFALGDLDAAERAYDDTLRLDPSNTDARRGITEVEKARGQYLETARDHTRLRLLREVDEAWEAPVPLPELAEGSTHGEFGTRTIPENATPHWMAGAGPSGGELASDRSESTGEAIPEFSPLEASAHSGNWLDAGGKESSLSVGAGFSTMDNDVDGRWLTDSEFAQLDGGRDAEAFRETDAPNFGATVLGRENALSGYSYRERVDPNGERRRFVPNYRLEAGAERAQRGLDALRQQIASQKEQLEASRVALFDIMEKNQLVDLGTEGARWDRGGEVDTGVSGIVREAVIADYIAETSIADLETTIEALDSLEGDERIGTAFDFGLTDPKLTQQYQQYQSLQLQQTQLAESGDAAAEDVAAVEAQLSHLRGDLDAAVTKASGLLKTKLELARETAAAGRLAKAREDGEKTSVQDRRLVTKYSEAKREYDLNRDILNRLEETLQKELIDQQALAQNNIPTPVPQAALDLETATADEPFSTFSLNVSDVSFKLAQAALLENGAWPEAAKIRPEEFVNAFDYGDPAPAAGAPVAAATEQCRHPSLPGRNLLRVSSRTAAAGRSASTPLRLVLLVDKSGSMERADREDSVARALDALGALLGEGDVVSAIGFSRTPNLLADRLSGTEAAELARRVVEAPPEGGTNIEEALELAAEKAREQFTEGAMNRIVLLTDGAANLGDADAGSLNQKVASLRAEGIALDACGFGADGLDDETLEALARNGDGRYFFVDRPEDADSGFAQQLAGALRPAANNVKVQIEFNPERVRAHRLSGFEKHRLEGGLPRRQRRRRRDGRRGVGLRRLSNRCRPRRQRRGRHPLRALPRRLDRADGRALLGDPLRPLRARPRRRGGSDAPRRHRNPVRREAQRRTARGPGRSRGTRPRRRLAARRTLRRRRTRPRPRRHGRTRPRPPMTRRGRQPRR